MDLDGIILTEISQTEKDKQYMLSYICRIQKNKPAKYNKQRNSLIDIENSLVATSGWWRGIMWVGMWEVQIIGCKIC